MVGAAHDLTSAIAVVAAAQGNQLADEAQEQLSARFHAMIEDPCLNVDKHIIHNPLELEGSLAEVGVGEGRYVSWCGERLGCVILPCKTVTPETFEHPTQSFKCHVAGGQTSSN